MLHDVEKLFLVDLTVLILVEFVDHGLELLVVEIFAQLSSHVSQILRVSKKVDCSYSEGYAPCSIFIKEHKGLGELFVWIALGHFVSH